MTPSIASFASAIRDRKEAILSEWEEAVRSVCSPSMRLSREELRDDMPPLLDRLTAWLSTDSTDTAEAIEQKTTGAHAKHRLQRGVDLRELIHEYRLLRRIVLRHTFALVRDVDELQSAVCRFDEAIDHAITETAATYAKARDEARDLVLGILAHDLRNPLSAIKMAADRLSHAGPLNDAQVGLVSRLDRAADRIKRMLCDLLDVVRSRFGGAMPVHPQSFDFADVVGDATSELRLIHPARDITVEPRGDSRGEWDRDRIAQLVSNLVGNAVVHGHDPIRVTVVGDEREVELGVRNAGPQIPKELFPALFDPFRRGPSKSVDDEQAGLGLGLFICSEIVRAHQGSIAIDSNEHCTSFTVRLPKRRGDGKRSQS